MLKPNLYEYPLYSLNQPPSGGCVLKLLKTETVVLALIQPPSGGCVLKQRRYMLNFRLPEPAAFGRLCVETSSTTPRRIAAFPAAFGRLCVETGYLVAESLGLYASRLRAAVC